jgi:hypothetical protein
MQVAGLLADNIRVAAAFAELGTQNVLVSKSCTCLHARWGRGSALLQVYSPEYCAALLQMSSPPPHDASARLSLHLTAY